MLPETTTAPAALTLAGLGWAGTAGCTVAAVGLGGWCLLVARKFSKSSAARHRLHVLLADAAGEDARIVITGATSGIGLELARQLARHASTSLLLGCRDTERAEGLFAQAGPRVRVARMELLDFDSVQSFTDEAHEFLKAGQPGLRLLISNAGVMSPPKKLKPAALDTTWQTNFLAPFLMTELLARRRALDSVQHPLRIVQVSSRLEKRSGLSKELLEAVASGDVGSQQYSDSKRATMLWTSARAQGLAFKGQSFMHCSTPGMVDTELGRHAVHPTWLWPLTKPLRMALLRTPAEGALSAAASGLRPQASGTFGRYLDGERQLEDLVMDRKGDKQLAQQLIKWATQATALEQRALGYER